MRYMTIGSGSAVPQEKRSAPCHLIRHGDCTVVVDLGPGSVWGILRHGGVSPRDIGLILLTHLHMDHCADLAPLLFALRFSELARSQPLHIIGPRGLLEHYDLIRATWEHRVDPHGFDLVIEEWDDGAFNWESITVRAAHTSHSVVNLAWRIDHPDSPLGVIITGDGQSTGELVSLASRGDHILVAECAAGVVDQVEGHMNARQAGILADACGSRKLLLCHINPGAGTDALLKEAMAQFDGEVVVAEDGMEIEIV